MSDGGWRCCCCTVISYDFCGLCADGTPFTSISLPISAPRPYYDPWWNNFRLGSSAGDWGCAGIASYGCSLAMWETTGVGSLISSIPLTQSHYARIQTLRPLEVGESLSLILGWLDAGDYIEVSLSRTGTTTGTSQIILHRDGTPNVLETCELDCSSMSTVAMIYGCVQSGYVLARTNCCTMVTSATAPGQYAGFGHSTATPIAYSLFSAAEYDTLTYLERHPASLPDVYCGNCNRCLHATKPIPYVLTATIIDAFGCAGLIGHSQQLRFVWPCVPGIKCLDVGGDEGLSCNWHSNCPSDLACSTDGGIWPAWFPYLNLDPTQEDAGLKVRLVDIEACDEGEIVADLLPTGHSCNPLWWTYRWYPFGAGAQYNGLTSCCDNPTCTDCYVDILISA